MEPLPYYRWLVRDYRANRKVQRMGYLARGFYRELLDEAWLEGSLPVMIDALAEICGCSESVMRKAWPEIAPCFEERDGRLFNRKLEDQRTEKDRHRVKMAIAGAAGGIAKQKLANASKSHIAEHSRAIAEKSRESTSARSVPPEELAGTLPLADGNEFEVSKIQIAEWAQAFPGIDVKQQLKAFKVWFDANPTNRKTRRGMPRAIVGWLGRAQDKSRGGGNGYHAKSDGNKDALRRAIEELGHEPTLRLGGGTAGDGEQGNIQTLLGETVDVAADRSRGGG